MNVKGKYILQANVATIWPMLQDEEVLARISPGVSKIEKTGADQYKAISDISIGPVRGSFEGDLALLDKIEHERMTLALSQKSKIGNAEAKIVMNLNPLDADQTEITYTGKAKVSGRLATMGQRILGGVVTTLSKQVFKELEKILEERKELEISDDAQESTSSVPEEVEVSATTSASEEQVEIRKSLIQKIIDKIMQLWK